MQSPLIAQVEARELTEWAEIISVAEERSVFTDVRVFTLDSVLVALTSLQEFAECDKDTQPVCVPINRLIPDLCLQFTCNILPFETLAIERELGKGGYAVVQKAAWNGIPVAVKIFFDPENSEDLFFETQSKWEHFSIFHREAEIGSRLVHPNLTLLHGVCLKPLALVVQYAPLGALDELLRRDRLRVTGGGASTLNWPLKRRIVKDICNGMQFLHSLQPPIVHRDLKSPNVLIASLDPSAAVVAQVSDFGTSAIFLHTIRGRQTFCPYWIAPEILANSEAEYNQSIDVYAFGIIMWEVLTENEPFSEYDERFADSPTVVFEEAVVEGLRPTIPATCPPLYAELMSRAWQHRSKARPSFTELSNALGSPALDPEPQ